MSPAGTGSWYSGVGPSHGGVRWKTSNSPTTGAISGMNCTALAPVPMTATRLPRRSRSWSHRAEWNEGPVNDSRPGMFGYDGRFSWPTALTTAFETIDSSVPSGVRTTTVHERSFSDHVADNTSVLKRM